MSSFIALLVAGIFTDNIITAKLLGIDQLSEKDSSVLSLLKKCGVLTALLLLSCAVSYPVTAYILAPLKLEYLSALVAVIIICAILTAAFLLSRKHLPAVYGFLAEDQKVLTCSAVVLGLCLNITGNEHVTGYLPALAFAIASGIGFTVVSLLFYGIRHRLEAVDIPEAVKGLPVTLIISALISMAFSGLA